MKFFSSLNSLVSDKGVPLVYLTGQKHLIGLILSGKDPVLHCRPPLLCPKKETGRRAQATNILLLVLDNIYVRAPDNYEYSYQSCGFVMLVILMIHLAEGSKFG